MVKNGIFLILLAGSISLGCSQEAPGASPELPKAEIQICFVPGQDCTQFVVDAVRLAEKEILVQAYNYTSPPILQAIANAKTKRKLEVKVILDKSNEQERYTGATYMANHGIPVLIDYSVAIAHNKVIIIDGKHVITGSFNFTQSAQKRNAENVILIKNNPKIAGQYRKNWESRATVSRPPIMKPGS